MEETRAGTMWFPDTSYGKEDPQNCNSAPVTGRTSSNKKHQGKKGIKIERRKVATVDVAGVTTAVANSTSPTDSGHSDGYSTIENNSVQGLEKFDNWKDDKEISCVSGWRGDENIVRMTLLQNDSTTTMNSSRNTLQSRDASTRLYSSHLTTQMSKKREKYKFIHAHSPKDHIKTYKELCGFSYLVLCTRRSNSKNSLPKEEMDKKQEATSEKEIRHKEKKPEQLPKPPTAVKESAIREHRSSSRSLESRIPSIPLVTGLTVTDRVLHVLANRLGVRESIDEPKLLYSPVRNTTPSITRRKTEPREDLTLYPKRKSDNSNSNSKSNSSNSTESRPSTKQSKQRRSPHLLPKIDRKHKSTSSISLSKYFHVNTKAKTKATHNNRQEEVEEGEDTIPVSQTSSLYSLASNQSCEESPATVDDYVQLNCTIPFDSSLQKEVAIRRKADSLGLLSRKWAKNFIERGFMNGSLPRKVYYDYSSRQATRETKRIDNQRVLSTAKRKEKMQELRDVYSTRNNSRTCSRKSARRETGTATTSTTSNRHTNRSQTRPSTRAGKEIEAAVTRQKSEFHHHQNKAPLVLPASKREFQLHGLTHKISIR